MISFLRKKIRFIIFFLLFIIIGPLVVMYANGDIFNGGGFLKTGGIFVRSSPIGSNIYINSKLNDSTGFFQRDILIKNLKPGKYDVSVKKDGYNSWDKKIIVTDNTVSEANVFILPEKVDLREIPQKIASPDISTSSSTTKTKNNQEYKDILSVFYDKNNIASQNVLATTSASIKKIGTKEFPIMNGKEGIWKEGGKVFVGWFGKENAEPQYLCHGMDCSDSMFVFDLITVPTNLGFLPGYEGVIIVAFENQVFAVQLEENPDKGVQLIYKGKKPDFRIINGAVYVKDGTYLAEVNI